MNGNILHLNRTGPKNQNEYELIDDLYYAYNGNRLTSVEDHLTTAASDLGFRDLASSSNEYSYDANGNIRASIRILNFSHTTNWKEHYFFP